MPEVSSPVSWGWVQRWMRYNTDFIRRRYNGLAPIQPVFEYVFWLPRGIRRRAVRQLELFRGARVPEVACGTGRNLPFLIEAVGPSGHVYGVDLSEGNSRGRGEALRSTRMAERDAATPGRLPLQRFRGCPRLVS